MANSLKKAEVLGPAQGPGPPVSVEPFFHTDWEMKDVRKAVIHISDLFVVTLPKEDKPRPGLKRLLTWNVFGLGDVWQSSLN